MMRIEEVVLSGEGMEGVIRCEWGDERWFLWLGEEIVGGVHEESNDSLPTDTS